MVARRGRCVQDKRFGRRQALLRPPRPPTGVGGSDWEGPRRWAAIQRQIDATDRQIDQFVYELYGLTDDEIRIVEDATA